MNTLEQLPFTNYNIWQNLKFYGTYKGMYTDEVWQKLNAETDFTPLEQVPMLPPEVQEKVGMGLAPCPKCKWQLGGKPGNLREIYIPHAGVTQPDFTVRYPVACPCRFAEAIWQHWAGAKAMVPPRYRSVRLRTLKPTKLSRMPLEQQEVYILALKENPDDSYLLCGPSGYGTTYLTALLSRALSLWADRKYQDSTLPMAVFRVRAQTLMEELTAWETRKGSLVHNPETGHMEEAQTKIPTVTADTIRAVVKAGLRPSLFLEELDKISISAYKLSKLFDILDTVYEANGQIVITSNMNRLELETYLGDRIGPTIIRRVTPEGEGYQGHIWDFTEEPETDVLSAPKVAQNTSPSEGAEVTSGYGNRATKSSTQAAKKGDSGKGSGSTGKAGDPSTATSKPGARPGTVTVAA